MGCRHSFSKEGEKKNRASWGRLSNLESCPDGCTFLGDSISFFCRRLARPDGPDELPVHRSVYIFRNVREGRESRHAIFFKILVGNTRVDIMDVL